MIARALALAGACATGASAAWVPWAGPGGSRCALVTGADARTVLALAGALPLREGMEVTARGARCRIVSLDSDPRAVVLLVRVDDPDREVWAHRVEITVEV